MVSDSTVYVVDGDGTLESVAALVRQKGLQAEGFSSVDDFLANYDPSRKGCVVLDIGMAGNSGLDLLQKLKVRKNLLPLVVITGYADVAMAVRAMRWHRALAQPALVGGCGAFSVAAAGGTVRR